MIRRDLLIGYQRDAREQRVLRQSLTLMETLQSQLDPEMAGWSQIGGETKLTDANLATLDDLRKASLKATYQDPNGRGIIRTFVKFVIGQGIVVDFHEKDENKLQSLWEWWTSVTRANKWFSLLREFVIRAFRDGEVFLRKVVLDGVPMFRFIEPGKVLNPPNKNADTEEGIETDPADAETIVAYHVHLKESWEKIDAAEMIHFKMNVDRNVRRGRPELETVLPLFAKYAKWLDTRIILNVIRTSVALIREVQGSPTDLLRLRNQQVSTSSTGTEQDKMKMMRPGTIITSPPGVKYNMISPNIDARDAAQDGRSLQLAMAAAEGLPDVFVTGDYAQANFASTIVSQNPAVRAFEEHQNIFREPFTDMIEWTLQVGVEEGALTRNQDRSFDISYPPLLKRDLRQEVEAWQIMNERQVASRRTWQVNMGLNPDQEKKFLDDEGPVAVTQHVAIRPAVKRVEDRQPRQNVQAEGARIVVAQPGKSGAKRITMKIVPITEALNSKQRTFNIECEVAKGDGDVQKSFNLECAVLQPARDDDLERDTAA